ncbi:MAG: hypothetical protein EOP34_05085 [Rickettsiales bacterium]|nr:MAG: hypothetical protein EOP34_05085 [Rickettsiales bacterium]
MKQVVNNQFGYLSKATELKKRIYFTFVALLIFRIGSYIPLPSINSSVLLKINLDNSSGILGMLNILSGGSLGRMSIFALAIMPYITSSIIMQLITVIYKDSNNTKKNDESNKKKINKYTRYLTVLLAVIQGLGIAFGLERMIYNDISLVNAPGIVFESTTVVTLTTGTIFLMWLSEQITVRGVGNGSSLILFSGIVAGVPSSLLRALELVKTGSLNPVYLLGFLIL